MQPVPPKEKLTMTIQFTTHAEYAGWVARKARFPISSAAELIALHGNADRTVTYMGTKIKLETLKKLPASFFPVKDEADLLSRMNSSDTYFRDIGVKPRI
jgi:hypothetical protein